MPKNLPLELINSKRGIFNFHHMATAHCSR